nr:glutamine amidotransferase [Patescibacteria group bacterium]
FEGLPGNFKAFAGHKESVEKIPPGATIVATGEQCPVQAFRMGNNVYGFQFHPELDPEGLAVRVNVYKNMGYFKPEEADVIIAMARSETVTVPRKILANFLNKYKNPNFNIT